MDMEDRVSCVLCQQSEETKVTGVLSTKDEVTAHQNCLLFSSGIFCRYSPQFDDLFGFSVDDVMSEVKRGNKLICSQCKKKGATAGCEVGRCKKSFHYPCAVTAGAKIVENADKGNYGLYCVRHSEARENGVSVNGIKKPQTSDAALSKVHRLVCEIRESKSLGCLSDDMFMLHCDKRAASSQQRSSGDDSTAAGSVSSRSCTPSTSKRRRSFDDKLEEKTPKRRSEGWNGMISDSSSDSADADMAIFAPLEFDSEDSANSVPEQVTRKDTDAQTGSDSGRQLDSLSNEGNEDDTGAESPSLLPPVSRTEPLRRSNTQEAPTVMKGATVQEEEEFSPEMTQHTSEPTVPQQTSVSPPLPPAAPPETVCASLHALNPKPGIDSTRFWKGCNAAGCTQAMFAEFIREMEEISSRIQSDKARQEDYDCALRVMEASGKLSELVIRQQEEIMRKHAALEKAAAAMTEVLSALKR